MGTKHNEVKKPKGHRVKDQPYFDPFHLGSLMCEVTLKLKAVGSEMKEGFDGWEKSVTLSEFQKVVER